MLCGSTLIWLRCRFLAIKSTSRSTHARTGVGASEYEKERERESKTRVLSKYRSTEEAAEVVETSEQREK